MSHRISKAFIGVSIGLWVGLMASIVAAAPAAAPTAVTTAKPVGVLTATCNDGGTYYHVTGEHRGACSGHGGVKAWADGSPVHSSKARSDYRPGKK